MSEKLNIKHCGECRYHVCNRHGGCCTFIGDAMCDDDLACDNFERPTVFDRITQSPEVLAHTYIYTVLSTDNEVFFCSALLSPTQTFVHLDEAIAATVARLNEVENG